VAARVQATTAACLLASPARVRRRLGGRLASRRARRARRPDPEDCPCSGGHAGVIDVVGIAVAVFKHALKRDVAWAWHLSAAAHPEMP